ncbi:hypothetical protein AVEN_236646-1 [Araneus ventricosus]|uniref:Tc1-like transposase DDE domain-containing protein n=1 Tax=Araneus ventricosus TaxID=182803 RepID=A0A4Y2VFG7_ARAVE|nr:hypothetical protein AVEN_236646-1 [Araneus ventricosus]
MNACCGEQKRNERLKLALHWTVSQRVSVVQRCARAGDDATPRTPTVTSNIYLDMLQLYAVPQFPEGVIFQQDGAPPHYGNIVREFLDTTFPQRCCHGMATTIPGPNAIRLLLLGLCEATCVQ